MPAASEARTTRWATPETRVHRFEVRVKAGRDDPRAAALLHDAAALGVNPTGVRVARVYLVRAALTDAQRERVGRELLSNPILEDVAPGAPPAPSGARVVEVHPLPGVMDPAAQTVVESARILLGLADDFPIEAATGWRYEFDGISAADAQRIARRLLANPVIHAIHTEPFEPQDFPHTGAYTPALRHIELRGLEDARLEALSREAHLFLSLDEMRAIRDEYDRLGREPTDIELETLAQTWSEHCVHKTLKSRITYRGPANDRIDWSNRPGHTRNADGSIHIDNLLKSTVAAATHELIAEGVDWTLSVFVDNAGIIAFDDDHAVCVKVETHNHPSAIEPYGGAATGAGGCIRDVLGTGLGARPIAAMDVFCVAHPDSFDDATLPAGCLHPKRILTQVVAGVRDYGNRVGVPTLSGAVWFDDRYVGNPLVYCGCVGVMPRDKVTGAARDGDRIIALGGRTGRDGIHGATFSSAELTDTHADEFAHAVQIGNAIEEKKVIDAVLRARDHESGTLFSAITDCGAGGFSSAVGEMGESLGAEVQLDRAPLKYAGLSYTEIWISEAQERMVLAVPPDRLAELQRICDEESVELADLGRFGTPGRELVLRYNGLEVGRMSMQFLHEGIPTPTREAEWSSPLPLAGEGRVRATGSPVLGAPSAHNELRASDARSVGGDGEGEALTQPLPSSTGEGPHAPSPLGGEGRGEGPHSASSASQLLALLAHPNIASKRWIIRQYDHEVQGATLIKPLVGPDGGGPGDASVIEPVPGSGRGLAISQGLATDAGDPDTGGDPYLMALAAADECVRNLVCVGADPERIAILDNFCWPSCAKPRNLGSLVRAAEGCYDAAKAYRTPFVSGKDSLNNQFTTEDGRTIEIPPTLLITGIGVVHDVNRCITMDAKAPGNPVLLVGPRPGDDPRVTDLAAGPATAHAVARCIREGLVASAHDCSEGGWLVALAEMCIAGDERVGANIDAQSAEAPFVEAPSRYLLEVKPGDTERVRTALGGVRCEQVATLDDSGELAAPALRLKVSIDDCRRAFFAPLDW